MSLTTVYGIKYCDGDYGAFDYGLFSNLELAREHYELAKADVIEKKDQDCRFEDLPPETFPQYAETDTSMIVLYSFEIDHMNKWSSSPNKNHGYFHGWESLNDHIKVIAFSDKVWPDMIDEE